MLNGRHDGGGNGLVGGAAPHNRPGCGYQGGYAGDGYSSSCANYGGGARKYGAGGEHQAAFGSSCNGNGSSDDHGQGPQEQRQYEQQPPNRQGGGWRFN